MPAQAVKTPTWVQRWALDCAGIKDNRQKILRLRSLMSKKKNLETADSRSKKNYNPAACGTKTTFTER